MHYAVYSPRSKASRIKCKAGIELKSEVWNIERELSPPLQLESFSGCWQVLAIQVQKEENCHFSDSKPFDPEVLNCKWMESVVTSVDGPIRCHGVVYECNDAGSYGSTEYIPHEYNEQLGRYEKVAEMA